MGYIGDLRQRCQARLTCRKLKSWKQTLGDTLEINNEAIQCRKKVVFLLTSSQLYLIKTESNLSINMLALHSKPDITMTTESPPPRVPYHPVTTLKGESIFLLFVRPQSLQLADVRHAAQSEKSHRRCLRHTVDFRSGLSWLTFEGWSDVELSLSRIWCLAVT